MWDRLIRSRIESIFRDISRREMSNVRPASRPTCTTASRARIHLAENGTRDKVSSSGSGDYSGSTHS